MDASIHYAFLPHTDPEASLRFWRDILGYEVRADVGKGSMRWITVAPAGSPISIVLEPPAPGPGFTDDERKTIEELMAKGSFGRLTLASEDVDALFDKLAAAGVDVVQEPADQPYGVRDCAVRDPAGNLIRINQL
jgi:catechol 2,3-dioxygenase-like lactoylglutathione lyase family enzyme